MKIKHFTMKDLQPSAKDLIEKMKLAILSSDNIDKQARLCASLAIEHTQLMLKLIVANSKNKKL